jgi:hypothetical protein
LPGEPPRSTALGRAIAVPIGFALVAGATFTVTSHL